jgi:hypothetical protein
MTRPEQIIRAAIIVFYNAGSEAESQLPPALADFSAHRQTKKALSDPSKTTKE